MESSYTDPDYAFGQYMLTLRTNIGLTQAAVAEILGVSRRAVVTWESGDRYPSPEHLKRFITLAVQHEAFPAGWGEGEIRALWRMAREKVLLDEVWVASLLRQSHVQAQPTVSPPVTQTTDIGPARAPGAGVPGGSRLDLGDAPSVSTFYGRTWELDMLAGWTVTEGCRVVGTLGLGGIGKSTLAVSLIRRVADQFDVVIWRSLRDAPTIEALLDDCLQVVAPQALAAGDTVKSLSTEGRLNALLEYMRHTRLLLVLDNLETLLEEGAGTGQMRAGYEGFSRLLGVVAETEHRSCLLFTSREKPADLGMLEGTHSPVRTLRLAPLEVDACEALLEEKRVKGTGPERDRLIDAYAGNPLALKIVAQTIVDLFGGEPGPFLDQSGLIFGGVRDLLARQFNRLSALEQRIMIWLAILREPASLKDLMAVMATPVPPVQLLEAVEALHRRSMVERSSQPGRFTLQSVVLEYVISRLITDVSREIELEQLDRMIEYALELALVPEYIRQTQERLILVPTLAALRAVYPQQARLEEHLMGLLRQLATQADYEQGYGPSNLVALLHLLRGDLRRLDLSGLVLRNAYLQGVDMQSASLAGSTIRDSVFTNAFDIIVSVAISGEYWAVASGRGEVRVWQADGRILHRVWWDAASIVWRLAFSPDSSVLAGGTSDGRVKLWDLASGVQLWSAGRHASSIRSMSFSPDGTVVASCGSDGTVRIWDRYSGTERQILSHPSAVPVIAWSPNGRVLASGDAEGTIRVWEWSRPNSEFGIRNAELPGAEVIPNSQFRIPNSRQPLFGLAFSPDAGNLAATYNDGAVRVWNIPEARLQQTVAVGRDSVGHPGGGLMAWSPDGRTLAGVRSDHSVWLWDCDIEQGARISYHMMLRGHTRRVTGIAFTPDSHSLLSGSEDASLRIWDVANGTCIRVIAGYVGSLNAVDWSADGTRLVAGGWDRRVTIFDASGKGLPHVLHEHSGTLVGVAWSPQGHFIASAEWENTIWLLDPVSGEQRHVLKHPEDPGNRFYSVSWSPDGNWLAAGTDTHGVLVWDVSGSSASHPGLPRHRLQPPNPVQVSHGVEWSPDECVRGHRG